MFLSHPWGTMTQSLQIEGTFAVDGAVAWPGANQRGETDSPPQQYVDALVRTTRRDLEATIALLASQPDGAVSAETWSAFERTLIEADETFEELRSRGYDVAA
jgi:dienelactone hydrolase